MLLAYSGTEGKANVLDNSHTRGNLHRTRNQRLPAGRILIHRRTVLQQPADPQDGGLCIEVEDTCCVEIEAPAAVHEQSRTYGTGYAGFSTGRQAHHEV